MLVITSWALWLLPQPALAQTRWSEADVVRLARERAPEAQVAAATADLAEARAQVSGLRADPVLSWQREAIPGDRGDDSSSQDILQVTVPLDLSGRRHAQRLLARSTSAAMRAEAAEVRAEAVEQAVLAFYAVLAAELRAQALGDAVRGLEEAARVLARREEAGTASGYERDRLELETELARSRASDAQAEVQARRLVLVQLIAPELTRALTDPLADSLADPLASAPALAGELTTQEPEALDVLLERALHARQAAQEAARAARTAREAEARTGWAWLPTIGLSGGIHIARDQDTRYGYVAGLALDLPIFSRGRELRAEAAGQRRLADARVAAIERRVQSEIAEARAYLIAARREQARFEQATRERVELLGRAAESGYREGQRTILELVDAQRARIEVRLRHIELAVAAKRAELRLRRAIGELQ